MGISGLGTDVQTFNALMKFKMNMFRLKENREMKASTYSKLVSTSLYEKRFGPYMISPVVAGLDKISETEYAPVVCTYDSIGYREHSNGWECAGTASELLSGCAESYYRPNLEPEELFDVISNCLLSGIDRDSLAGWGAYVYLLTPTELTVRSLKTRMD